MSHDHKPARDAQTVRKLTGTYRGVRYEMNELDRGHAFESAFLPRVHWCGYVWLEVTRLPEADRDLVLPKAHKLGWGDRWGYSYADTIWSDAPFHCGCTFADVLHDPTPGKGPHVKAGCDWNHSWDSDAGFWGDASAVEQNLCEVIDWLISRFPILDEAATQ